MESKVEGLNKNYYWGINIDLNGTNYNTSQVMGENPKFNAEAKSYDEILSNIAAMKESSDEFIQKIIDENKHLLTVAKEKKKNDEEEIVE